MSQTFAHQRSVVVEILYGDHTFEDLTSRVESRLKGELALVLRQCGYCGSFWLRVGRVCAIKKSGDWLVVKEPSPPSAVEVQVNLRPLGAELSFVGYLSVPEVGEPSAFAHDLRSFLGYTPQIVQKSVRIPSSMSEDEAKRISCLAVHETLRQLTLTWAGRSMSRKQFVDLFKVRYNTLLINRPGGGDKLRLAINNCFSELIEKGLLHDAGGGWLSFPAILDEKDLALEVDQVGVPPDVQANLLIQALRDIQADERQRLLRVETRQRQIRETQRKIEQLSIELTRLQDDLTREVAELDDPDHQRQKEVYANEIARLRRMGRRRSYDK